MQVEIRLLGCFSVRCGGMEVPPAAFGGRLTRTLVKILVTRRGRFVSNDVLAEALWPGRAPADPDGSLAILINRARRGLGDPSLILTGPRGYSFAAGERCLVDAEAFLEQVEAVRERLAAGEVAGVLRECRAAIGGWGGEPLAEDTYEDWAQEYRSALLRAHLEVVERGAEAALALYDPTEAVRFAELAVAREPLREAGHLLRVRALAASGDTAAALAAFDAFRRRLAEELGLDPSPEAVEVQARILRGEMHPRRRRIVSFSPPMPVVSGPAFEKLPFVGRDRELQAILSDLNRSAPGTVVVSGPAGAGKSRLLGEVAARSALPVLPARAFLPERDEPWGLARVLLRETLALDPDAVRAVPERAAQALADLIPEIEELRPPLGSSPIDAESRRALALEAGVRLVGAAGSQGALVLADDLHWADATSLALLGLLIRRVPGVGALQREGADASELARHLAAAGDAGAAAQAFAGAARQSLGRHASEEAERIADAGLALQPRARIRSQLLDVRGEARFRRGDLAGARLDLREALAGKETGADRSRVLTRMALLASGSEDLIHAAELVELALTEAAGDPDARANALSVGAIVDMNAGRQERAHERFDEAFALFEQTSDARGIAHILDCQAMQTWLEGDLPKASEDFNRAAGLFMEIGELLRLGSPRASRGDVLVLMGRPAEGLVEIDGALELERSLGHTEGEAYALWYQSEALTVLGRLSEAMHSAEAALAIAEGLGHRELTAGTLKALAMAKRRAGDFPGAEAAIRRSLATAMEHLPLFVGFAAAELVLVLVARGALSEAQGVLRQALSVGMALSQYEARLAHAELAAARGDPDAQAIAASAVAAAKAGGHHRSAVRLAQLARKRKAPIGPTSRRPAEGTWGTPVSSAPRPVLALSQPQFAGAVRQALRDLHRPDRLVRNPLLDSRIARDRAGKDTPTHTILAQLIREAADSLRADPRDEKLYRSVDRTYLRPAETQERAADVLGLPFSTYRRHLTRAVDRIVAWLWDRELYGTGDAAHRNEQEVSSDRSG